MWQRHPTVYFILLPKGGYNPKGAYNQATVYFGRDIWKLRDAM